ncbi:hypothetical protein [Kangiella sp. M94]
MNKIYNFIKKTNTILIFILAVILIGTFSKDIIKDITRESYQPPKVEVANNQVSEEVKIEYKTKFYKKVKDNYLFKVNSDKIDQSVERKSRVFRMAEYEDEYTVNLMFVDNIGKTSYLLEKDAYIISIETPSFHEDSNHTVRNIYLIASEDTNEDGFLSHEDSITLYASKIDGTELTVAAKEVVDYKFSDTNEIIVNWIEDEISRHGIYYLENNKLLTLDIEI